MANRSSQFSRLPWGDRLRQAGRLVGKLFRSIGLIALIGCLISGLWGSALIPAWAATEPIPLAAPGSAAPISPDASAVPAEKVTQFVRAYLQVLALLERREGELRQAETEPEASRLEQEIELEAFEAIEQAFTIDLRGYFKELWPQLQAMQRDGLINLDAKGIRILPAGRLLARSVCMVFDAYLAQQNRQRFSRVI